MTTRGPPNPGILKPWDDLINAYVCENGLEVIADYRDVAADLAEHRAIEEEEARKSAAFWEECEALKRQVSPPRGRR